MNRERKPLKIGIVYSGGISKCAYQIGFTKTLLKYIAREEIKLVSGASMGVFSAYALAANKLSKIEWMYRNVNLEHPWELFWQALGKDLYGKTAEEFFSVYDRLDIPMCFPVCYVPIFKTKYYWIKERYNPVWKKYIKAALNFPSLHLMPIIQRGRLAFDGAAADNVPIYPLLRQGDEFMDTAGLDLIIALHFDARYDPRQEFPSDVPILDLDVAICNKFKKDHFDFSRQYVDEMICGAEEYAEEICSFLFSGDCSKEDLQHKIDEIFLREHDLRAKNLSADRIVGVLNTLGRLCRSETNCCKRLY